VREAKLQNFTWHCLRHTFGTRLVRSGVDVKTVQDAGGWKTVGMVMKYAHADPSRIAPVLEKLCESSATSSCHRGRTGRKPVAHRVQ